MLLRRLMKGEKREKLQNACLLCWELGRAQLEATGSAEASTKTSSLFFSEPLGLLQPHGCPVDSRGLKPAKVLQEIKALQLE